MAVHNVELGSIIKAHYGKALKEGDRNKLGEHEVFGSSGAVGRHDQALTTDPMLVVGRKGSVGEVIWAPAGGWVIDTAYYIERLDPTAIDLRYLYYAMKRANLGKKSITTSIPGLNRDDLYATKIPLPPQQEQKRIAAILDKADAIRRKRQQAIQLADHFLRAVFLDMFGDPVTNPKGWSIRKFRDVGTLDRGKSKHRPRNDPALLGGAHPLIQTGDVANSSGYIRVYKSTYSDLGLQQSRKWPAGTLCITIAANIAKTGILTFDACFPDSVVGFSPNQLVTVEYVQHWLSFLQKTLEANAPESAQKNINLAILRDLDIPVPDVGAQNRFSEIVAKVVTNAERLRTFSNHQEALFSALSQKAFAGEL
jgi:type I restriction enzyme S subunit